MPSLYFALSNWLNYLKGFSAIAYVVKNNRMHCWIYCLTIEYCSIDQELYMVKFTALNLNYKWVFKRLLYMNPYLD